MTDPAPVAPAAPAPPAPAPPAAPVPAPQQYAGKFGTVAELEQAYVSGQQKITEQGQELGGLRNPQPAPPAGAAPSLAIPKQPAAPQDIDGILTQAGLSNDDLVSSWKENGSLTEAQYTALAGVNPMFNKSVIDQFIGANAQATAAHEMAQGQIQATAHEMVGGEQQMNNLLGWAGQNMPQARTDDLNRRLADPSLFEGALMEIQAAHQTAIGAGTGQPIIEGGAAAAGSGMGATFQNVNDQSVAMLDKRYAPVLQSGMPNPDHDPAYYNNVRQRLMMPTPP